MSLHGDYDPQNIFAKILSGAVPSVKVYEDDEVLAFMDIFPQAEGHTLVVPKGVMARNLLDMPASRIDAFMERVQKIAIAVDEALSPDGIVIVQYNGAPAGQTVFHLHFHIIPRREGDSLRPHGSEPAEPADLEDIAARIRACL